MTPVALFIFGINAKRVGGLELHIHEVVTRLADRGWQAVLCFDQPPAPEVRQYLSLPNVTWEVLPKAWINSRETSAGFARLVKQYRPRLLHLQFTPFLSLTPWIARRYGIKKIYFTDHGSHPEGYQPVRQPLWKRIAGGFLTTPMSFVVAVSDYNCRALTTLGIIRSSRVRRIYNGADLTRWTQVPDSAGAAFRQQHGIPADRVLVTQVSWIIPEKGIPDVLDAARIAVAQEPALHFVFVGDGKYRDEYARRAVEMGLADHVTWTGLVKDPMTEGVFTATDIACQASRWQEAFGYVIAEAMAFAKPVVGTRVGGIPELIADGQNGFLVPRGDTAALAEKLVLLARDRELRERLGRAARRHAEAEFDIRKNVSTLFELYGDLSV